MEKEYQNRENENRQKGIGKLEVTTKKDVLFEKLEMPKKEGKEVEEGPKYISPWLYGW